MSVSVGLVTIADDHAIVREGLRAMFAVTPDIALAAEVESRRGYHAGEENPGASRTFAWWDYGFQGRNQTNQADDCLGELLSVSDPDRITVPFFASSYVPKLCPASVSLQISC
jgi:hypothetical protein